MISLLVNETKEGAPSLEQIDRKMEEDRRKDVPKVSTTYHVFLRRGGTTLVSIRKLISDSVETGSIVYYSMTH